MAQLSAVQLKPAGDGGGGRQRSATVSPTAGFRGAASTSSIPAMNPELAAKLAERSKGGGGAGSPPSAGGAKLGVPDGRRNAFVNSTLSATSSPDAKKK